MAGPIGDLLVLDVKAGVAAALSGPAQGTPPPPRGFHGAVSMGGKLFLHGGDGGEASAFFGSVYEPRADLFAFDPATLTWVELSGLGVAPGPRRMHGLAAADGKLYVHGGDNVSGESATTAAEQGGFPSIAQ
jgi:hypothetical protein